MNDNITILALFEDLSNKKSLFSEFLLYIIMCPLNYVQKFKFLASWEVLHNFLM